jgi:hypothetical protein
MTSNSVEPATVAAVNGLEEVDRLAGLIIFKRRLFLRTLQAVYRTRTRRTRRTRWIVARRRRDASRSIPVYVRRSELLWSAVHGGVA